MIKLKHLLYEKLYIRDHDEVVEIQTILDKLGYDLGPAGIDGIYGRYTKNAVRDYQRDNGTIRVDGLVGPETWPELQKEKEKLDIPQDEIEKNKEEVPDQSNTHTKPVDDDEVEVTELDISQPVTIGSKYASKEEHVRGLERAMDKHGIINPYLRIAMLGIVGKETGFRIRSEDKYGGTPLSRLKYLFNREFKKGYKWQHVAELFGKNKGDKMTDDEILKLSFDDIAFYDQVYGKRYDNDKPGDGFTYRGRGYNQMTFKDKYIRYGNKMGVDLVNNPDKMNEPRYATEAYMLYTLKTARRYFNPKDPNVFNNQRDANVAMARLNAGMGKNPDSANMQKTIQNTTNAADQFSYPGLEQDDQIA